MRRRRTRNTVGRTRRSGKRICSQWHQACWAAASAAEAPCNYRTLVCLTVCAAPLAAELDEGPSPAKPRVPFNKNKGFPSVRNLTHCCDCIIQRRDYRVVLNPTFSLVRSQQNKLMEAPHFFLNFRHGRSFSMTKSPMEKFRVEAEAVAVLRCVCSEVGLDDATHSYSLSSLNRRDLN